MGRDAGTKEFLLKVLAAVDCPVVLDADALNLLAGEKASSLRGAAGSS